MKTKIEFFLFLFVAVTCLLTSCDDDGDTTKPVINLISPTEGQHLQIGNKSGVHLEMELSDNEMLASYSIDIHNNFDDHDHVHATTRSEDSDDDLPPFSFNKSWEISGQKNATIHHYEIVIPDSVRPGNYHMVVYGLDAAGNESYVARNIVLTKEEQPGHH